MIAVNCTSADYEITALIKIWKTILVELTLCKVFTVLWDIVKINFKITFWTGFFFLISFIWYFLQRLLDKQKHSSKSVCTE